MIEINKDILTLNSGIIVHQVNCKGVMGAGLALAIKKKYPVVYEVYKNRCNAGYRLLGSADIVLANHNDDNTTESLSVVNLYAQDDYGRDKRHTNYKAFELSLMSMKATLRGYDGNDIYFPYGIGCGLGGGSWEIILSLIEKHFPNAIICRK